MSPRIFIVIVAMTAMLCQPVMAQPKAVEQPAVSIAGTRVSLISPPGFTRARAYSGLESRETGASIMVTELPGPYAQITAGFNAEGLQSRGMTLLSKASTMSGSFPAMLLHVSQVAYGATYLKWIMAFGDETQTVLVTATWPEMKSQLLADQLKQSVLSARLNTNAPPPDPMADLTFTMRDTAQFKLARRIQNMLVYAPAEKNSEGVVFIVGQSLVEGDVPEKSTFARQRMMGADGFKDIRIESESPVSIGGLNGVETIALASDQKTERAVVLYQMMLFGQNTYYVMQGIADEHLRPRFEPAFRGIAQQFKVKAAPAARTAKPATQPAAKPAVPAAKPATVPPTTPTVPSTTPPPLMTPVTP